MNDPFAGTWKLNAAKSKFAGPRKAPRDLTLFIQEEGRRALDTVMGVAADGFPTFDRYTFPNTGGDVTVLEGGGSLPPGTSSVLAARRADSRIRCWTISMPSGMVIKEEDVLSEDGQTMVMTMKGTDAQGNPYESVLLFSRE